MAKDETGNTYEAACRLGVRRKEDGLTADYTDLVLERGVPWCYTEIRTPEGTIWDYCYTICSHDRIDCIPTSGLAQHPLTNGAFLAISYMGGMSFFGRYGGCISGLEEHDAVEQNLCELGQDAGRVQYWSGLLVQHEASADESLLQRIPLCR